jgi:hypothetical protein
MSRVTAREVLGEMASIKYDHAGAANREVLSVALEATMKAAGFEQEPTDARTHERVYSRAIHSTGMRVQVFSTIVEGSWAGQTVRSAGADAIRVIAVYRDSAGRDRGVVKSARVHRVGEIGAICERTLERMREVWGKAQTGRRCHCGAPKFAAKTGKIVCADLCWTRAKT